MTHYDSQTVERLIEEITREVLLRLNQPAQTDESCNCTNGSCVQDCADCVDEVVKAGATRISATLGVQPRTQQVAGMIDHTLLKPDASEAEVAQLCYEAKTYHFASVCVNSTHVPLCAKLLKGSDVKVCTVIGFPLGATPTAVKSFEAQQAVRDGATEIDMVLNIGALKSKHYDSVLEDIGAVTRVGHAGNAIVKVIIETALLTDEEKVIASQLCKTARADFVKTSTGFGPGGATVADVSLMRRVVGAEMGVKASGGVRNYADAQAMIAAGATRIGASAGIKIVSEPSGRRSAEGGNY